jgi:endonuclease-3
MHNQRSRTLKRVAEAVIQRFDGDLTPVMGKPYPEARLDLMDLPGVGPKTADVVLMFTAGKEIVPVDRHIFRISKRLEMVSGKASYDEVRLALYAFALMIRGFLEFAIKFEIVAELKPTASPIVP